MRGATLHKQPAASPAETVTLLVGSPNVGKSVLFGLITGSYAQVSNYPGTTVDITYGRRRGGDAVVIDLPGTHSLIPHSEDEQVTRDALLDRLEEPGLRVVQVCDSKNLRQGLFLTLQLAELELPLVVVANMTDEAARQGLHLERLVLAAALGVEVLQSVATRGTGLDPLIHNEIAFRRSTAAVRYPEAIEQAVARLEGLLPESMPGRRGISLMLLAGDKTILPWVRDRLGADLEILAGLQGEMARTLGQDPATVINRTRQETAERLRDAALRREAPTGHAWSEVLGGIALHPLWGIPIAVLVMYIVYLVVGVLGAGVAVDFLENAVFAARVMPWLDNLLHTLLPSGLEAFLVGPPGTVTGTGPGLLIGEYGVISMGLSYAVAIVLPIVGFFFIVFSTLEDSGYLPRLAVLLNNVFRLIGLNGKAVLPMILGLGCDTMATMTARILPTRKERIIATLLLALGVPCSAQLGVIMGMLAGLSSTALIWWMGTVVLTMLAVGFLARLAIPGGRSAFLMEIPPLRVPVLGNILIKTTARIEWYVKEVVPLFLLGTFTLWLLERWHALKSLETLAQPVVQDWLGLPAKATGAFLIGFLRRDYGAAGLFDIFKSQAASGMPAAETEVQIIVALVTITLFVPCIANFFVIVKERGLRMALGMAAFIFPLAFLVGGVLNLILREVML